MHAYGRIGHSHVIAGDPWGQGTLSSPYPTALACIENKRDQGLQGLVSLGKRGGARGQIGRICRSSRHGKIETPGTLPWFAPSPYCPPAVLVLQLRRPNTLYSVIRRISIFMMTALSKQSLVPLSEASS